MNIAGFNEVRLAAQYETFGEPAEIGGLSCVVCASGHRGQAKLEDGGMGIEFERTVRARIADFPTPPKDGARAVVGGITYRVVAIGKFPHAGEYTFSLTQQR